MRRATNNIFTSIEQYRKNELRFDELKEIIEDCKSLNSPDAYPLNGGNRLEKAGNIVHYCVDYNLTEILELLVKKPNIEINSISAYDGRTPLINACINGNKEIVELLLNACPKHKLKTMINQRDLNMRIPRDGSQIANDHPLKTPLIYATLAKHIEIVQLLVKHGADCSIKDNEYKTAFDYAYDKGDMEIASVIARKSSLYNYCKVKCKEFQIYYNSTQIVPYDGDSDDSNTYNEPKFLELERRNQEFLDCSSDSVVEFAGEKAYNIYALEEL